jgi:hypothetical protein
MGLTWEAPCNEVNSFTQSICSELADIIVDRDRGPVVSKHTLTVGVVLAEGDGTEADSLEPEAKRACARKEVKDVHSC